MMGLLKDHDRKADGLQTKNGVMAATATDYRSSHPPFRGAAQLGRVNQWRR
jgi:hypothetical protein